MKAAILAVLICASGLASAQTFDLGTNHFLGTTNSFSRQDHSPMSLREPTVRFQLVEPTDTNSVDYVVSKTKVHLSGPLASALKSKSSSDLSHRVLKLFSPFSPATPNLPTGADVSGPVPTRAWSTIVGWSPGRSAFPDEAYHEPPQLRLISISTEKQP